MKLRQRSWIDIANEQVHIADVLSSLGVFVPESVKSGGNKKVLCPFGFYHSDGGISKAMRVYGRSNSAYCFSCSKSYNPVTLASAAWDCSFGTAAFRLLEDAGFKPKSLEERWADATSSLENIPDLIALADALKTFCSTQVADWAYVQLDDNVAELLNRCLNLLNSVKTEEEAVKWLETCKQVMQRKLISYDMPSNSSR